MELKEFISESLSTIINGIKEAHTKLHVTTHHPAIFHVGQTRNQNFDQVEKFEFEMLVNVGSNKTASGGAQIKVFSLGIGAEAKKESRHAQQNKIKFSVPVGFTKAIPPLKENNG